MVRLTPSSYVLTKPASRDCISKDRLVWSNEQPVTVNPFKTADWNS